MRKPNRAQLAAAYAAQLRASNKAFNAMTPRQKRVAIANDVLAMMRSRLIVPTNGQYLDAKNEDVGSDASASTSRGIKQIAEAQCSVCAKGSMFVAAVCRTNKISTEDVLGSHEEDMRLKVVEEEKLFDSDMWEAIEDAFEGVGDGHSFYRYYELKTEPQGGRYYVDCMSAEQEQEMWDALTDGGFSDSDSVKSSILLAAVCRNIISGKGNFDIDRRPSIHRVLESAALPDRAIRAIKKYKLIRSLVRK